MKDKPEKELKRVAVGTKTPFTIYKDEAGEFHLELPGSRRTVYFQELATLRDLLDDVYWKEELAKRPTKPCQPCGKAIPMHWNTCEGCHCR